MSNAIKKITGPCIILAGAGTGKTHAIVEKTKYLIENKIYQPEKIVCITFSNEAANSLYARIKSSIATETEPVVKTFHAFSADILRQHAEKINLKPDFQILTPDQAKIVLYKYFSILPSHCHRYIETIGTAKDLKIGVEEFENYLKTKLKNFQVDEQNIDQAFQNFQLALETNQTEKEQRKKFLKDLKKFGNLKDLKKFIHAWKAYEKIKKLNNYQDYSELNKNSLALIKKYPEISADYDYFIIDEFQDTNKIQLEFLVAIAPHKNITIVGDMNQSIYRFRGAYKENFDKFKRHFNVQPSDIFELDKSYRSPNTILSIANQLIKNNYENPKECFEIFNIDNRQGENIQVYELKDAKEEARKVVELINQEINQGTKPEEICIMFRTHQQGRIIKSALETEKIPFYSVTKKPLLKQKNIKIILNYLKILNNLKNNKKGGEQIWWDLIYQKCFSDQDLITIGKFLRDNRESENISSLIMTKLKTLPLSENGKIFAKILTQQINHLLQHTDKKVSELLQETYKTLGFNFIKTNDKKNKTLPNLGKLYDLTLENITLHYDDLSKFSHYINI